MRTLQQRLDPSSEWYERLTFDYHVSMKDDPVSSSKTPKR